MVLIKASTPQVDNAWHGLETNCCAAKDAGLWGGWTDFEDIAQRIVRLVPIVRQRVYLLVRERLVGSAGVHTGINIEATSIVPTTGSTTDGEAFVYKGQPQEMLGVLGLKELTYSSMLSELKRQLFRNNIAMLLGNYSKNSMGINHRSESYNWRINYNSHRDNNQRNSIFRHIYRASGFGG